MPAANRGALYLELAKAILQLLVVIILGALVAWVIKSFDTNKKADKALHDFRMDFLNRLRSLDESVKKSRHVLRDFGLTNQFGQRGNVIIDRERDAYDLEINSLQLAQSGIERLIQDIETFRGAFSDSVTLENKLRIMLVFLRNLVDEHEKLRPQFPQVEFYKLNQLNGFTGIPASREYNGWLEGYDVSVVTVRKDLLPTYKAVKT